MTCTSAFLIGITIGLTVGSVMTSFASRSPEATLPSITVCPELAAIRQENDILWDAIKFGVPCNSLSR